MPAFSSLSIPELVTIGGVAAPRKDGKTAAPDCPVTATFGAAGSVLTSDTGGFGYDRIGGPMRVLITGACGFVGRNLIAELENRGHELRLLDMTRPEHATMFPGGAERAHVPLVTEWPFIQAGDHR